MTEHLNDNLPLGYHPAYNYDGGTKFAYLGVSGVIEEYSLPAEHRRWTCPLHEDIREAEIPRLKKAVLERLPDANHIRFVRGALGTGIYAARYPDAPSH